MCCLLLLLFICPFLATFAESRQGSQFYFHHDNTSNRNQDRNADNFYNGCEYYLEYSLLEDTSQNVPALRQGLDYMKFSKNCIFFHSRCYAEKWIFDHSKFFKNIYGILVYYKNFLASKAKSLSLSV